MRYDLAFILCCCKACLPNDNESNEGQESFYDLLGVDPYASHDDIKRAYKRQSLIMHPDKLAQKGHVVTEEDKVRFTKMKDAYETLSDPHKRETYDAIGQKGLKWLEEPLSMDPNEMAHNFATSSTLDRSKIFAIFVTIFISIFLLPFLLCLQFDGVFGPNAQWSKVLIPLWIWNVIVLVYHVRVVGMGPIPKPDHIPEEEWVDPLPVSTRIISLIKFIVFVAFEILAALRLDEVIKTKWALVFIPIYVMEFITLCTKLPVSLMNIMTREEVEVMIGKLFTECTPEEREQLKKKYTIVSSRTSSDFEMAYALMTGAKEEITKVFFRVIFYIFLILQFDTPAEWSWWIVFTPLWAMSCFICCGHLQHYSEVQANVSEKFHASMDTTNASSTTTATGATGAQSDSADADINTNGCTTTEYGAMTDEESGGINGVNTQSTPSNHQQQQSQQQKPTPLSQSERKEMENQVFNAGARMWGSCCTQGFGIFLLCLFVAKLQGAEYSSLWILSPFLFIASFILCILGCTIFCVTPEEEYGDYDAAGAGGGMHHWGESSNLYTPPTTPAKEGDTSTSTSAVDQSAVTESSPTKATWDPERGEKCEGQNEDNAMGTPTTTTTTNNATTATNYDRANGCG